MHYGRGWCAKHWMRWRRHGDPLGGGTSRGEPLRYFHEVVLPYDGDVCLAWPFARTVGYGVMQYQGAGHLVSRLVCEAFNGPPPTPKHEAAHSCGKGHLGCVARKHLRWATRAENKADEVLHGVHTRGARNGMAKLTALQAKQIRDLRGTMTPRAIATRFGISRQGVSKIHLRQTYNI